MERRLIRWSASLALSAWAASQAGAQVFPVTVEAPLAVPAAAASVLQAPLGLSVPSLAPPLAWAPLQTAGIASLRPLPIRAAERASGPASTAASFAGLSAKERGKSTHSLAYYDKLFVALKYYLLGKGYYSALKALDFARSYHVGTRKDGVTPEFQHQLSIALYLTTLKDVQNEEQAVTAALLHDVMEDYDVGQDEIESRFGKEMARIVWLLTKEHRGAKKDPRDYFEEISKDPVASLVKGADRMHNVQSMVGVFSIEKQKEYIAEVQQWFLPMLKRARYHFPEQSAAYFNIQHMLKSQVQLLQALHEASAPPRGR